MYQSIFSGYCFTYNNLGHKVVDCKAYGRNIQERDVYVDPYNIKCYKFHNYENIACDFRNMMDTSIKENTDIGYNKICRRKEKKEEQVNEKIPEIILMVSLEL